MDDSPLAQFIEKAKQDEDLKQKVYEAEKAAAREIERHADVITRIAADAGYDLSDWNGRPDKEYDEEKLEAGDSCTFTCCFTWTSTA